jgi:nucleoside-diphosphate-sugar epimerase
MARVLITGANGFAGPYVAAALASRGHEVHGVTKVAGNNTALAIDHWYSADLTDYKMLREVVSEVRPDHVLHLAAISFVPHARIAEIYETNIVGTRNLLEALADQGIAGSTMIVSSAHVYGNRVGGALNETCPVEPHSDYAVSKLACEHLGRMYQDRVPNIIVRPFNYTGRGQEGHFIIPKIVNHVRSKENKIELGNIDVARDFSDVRFFAEAVVRLLTNPNALGETVNICSGNAYPLAHVLDLVREISGHTIQVNSNPEFIRVNDVMQLWGDPTKLQNLIGPLDGPSLEETLRWMLQD